VYERCINSAFDYWEAEEVGHGFFRLKNIERKQCIPEPQFCGDSPTEIFDLVDCHSATAALFNQFDSQLLLYSARCFIQVGVPTVFGSQRNCNERAGWDSQGIKSRFLINWLLVPVDEEATQEIFFPGEREDDADSGGDDGGKGDDSDDSDDSGSSSKSEKCKKDKSSKTDSSKTDSSKTDKSEKKSR